MNDFNEELENSKRKKKTRVYSEAFPPNILGFREKIPAYSGVHKNIIDFKIKEENIIYREMNINDLSELIYLHKEWFPINYDEEFFLKILDNDKKEKEYFTLAAVYRKENLDYILGLILCELRTEQEFREVVPEENLLNIDIPFFDDLNIFRPKYEFAYIMTIGVIDEFRKMKLGTKLLEKMTQVFLSRKYCFAIYLHVVNYNESAIKFYLKNNFKEVTTLKNYYKIRDDRYDSKVFVKFLNGKLKHEIIDSQKKLIEKLSNYFLVIPFQLIIFIFSFGFLFRSCRRNNKLD